MSGDDGLSIPWLTLGTIGLMTASYGVLLGVSADCRGALDGTGCAAVHVLASHEALAAFALPFLHGSDVHLIRNAVALLVFGSAVELGRGRWSYLAVGFGTAYASIWLAMLVGVTLGRPPVAIGMSGGVFGLMAFLAVTEAPHDRADLRRVVRMQSDHHRYRFAAVATAILAVGLATARHLGVVAVSATTATDVHLIGVALGGIAGLYVRLGGPTE